MPDCQSNRTDGAPCSAPPGANSYCFWHDPERRDEMLAASRNGGSRRAIPLPLDRPLEAREARGLLASVLLGVIEGALDPTTARTIGYLLQVERKIAEAGELERRITILEDAVQRGDGGACPR